MTTTALLPHAPLSAHPPFSPRRHRPGTMLCCPQCRLGLRQRHPQMSIDYCPRCIARMRQLVPLLPAADPPVNST
ncbi:MAG TPA: hypothetical protein VGI76_03560 [Solirubrobacteraceae bacterium]